MYKYYMEIYGSGIPLLFYHDPFDIEVIVDVNNTLVNLFIHEKIDQIAIDNIKWKKNRLTQFLWDNLISKHPEKVANAIVRLMTCQIDNHSIIKCLQKFNWDEGLVVWDTQRIPLDTRCLQWIKRNGRSTYRFYSQYPIEEAIQISANIYEIRNTKKKSLF